MNLGEVKPTMLQIDEINLTHSPPYSQVISFGSRRLQAATDTDTATDGVGNAKEVFLY